MHLDTTVTSSKIAVPIIDMSTGYIAHGKTFIRSDRVTIASNGVARLLGRLGDRDLHLLRWSFSGSRSGLIAEFYENPEVISNGSLRIPVNRNRIHPEFIPTIQTYVNPVIGNEGLLLYQTGFPGSGSGASSNVVLISRDPYGWLLNRDNIYMWKLSNTSNQNMEVYVEIDWAEL